MDSYGGGVVLAVADGEVDGGVVEAGEEFGGEVNEGFAF